MSDSTQGFAPLTRGEDKPCARSPPYEYRWRAPGGRCGDSQSSLHPTPAIMRDTPTREN